MLNIYAELRWNRPEMISMPSCPFVSFGAGCFVLLGAFVVSSTDITYVTLHFCCAGGIISGVKSPARTTLGL